MIDVLVDSSYLYALFSQGSKQHSIVLQSSQQARARFIILEVVLTEVAYLFRRKGGTPAVTQFITGFVSSKPNLQSLTSTDLLRARDVMNAYPRAELDFVDCCLVAVAERLKVTTIATLDRRDFQIIRPRHVDALEIMP